MFVLPYVQLGQSTLNYQHSHDIFNIRWHNYKTQLLLLYCGWLYG